MPSPQNWDRSQGRNRTKPEHPWLRMGRETKQGARSPPAPLAAPWPPCQTLPPPWKGQAAPSPLPPLLSGSLRSPPSPAGASWMLCCCGNGFPQTKSLFLTFFFFHPLVKEKKIYIYTRGPVYLKDPCPARELACNGHSVGTRCP